MMGITYDEAAEIASAVDPRAGGFFRQCLVQAAMKGADLEKKKAADKGHPADGREEESTKMGSTRGKGGQ